MKMIITLLVVLASFNANAYRNHFDFGVYSDAGAMWVCGASIDEGGDHNYMGGGFLSARLAGTPRTVSSAHGNTGYLGVKPGNFNFSSDAKKPVSSLQVKLGSEKYGSSYSVTICWEAAWFAAQEAANANTFRTEYISNVESYIYASNGNYGPASNLHAEVRWSCQGVNNGSTAIVSSPVYEMSNMANAGNTYIGNGTVLSANDWIYPSAHAFTKCTATYTYTERSTALRGQNQSVSIHTQTELYRAD